MEREPPTGVIQDTAWLEAALALAKLQECGLGEHLPVKVTTLINEQVMLQILLVNMFMHA